MAMAPSLKNRIGPEILKAAQKAFPGSIDPSRVFAAVDAIERNVGHLDGVSPWPWGWPLPVARPARLVPCEHPRAAYPHQ
jgi:hypothetical protein